MSWQRNVGSSSRVRISYADSSQQMVDNHTDYSERIQVIPGQRGNRLSLQQVQLSDEREFFCQVNGLAAGTAEGKTHLRVFGTAATGSSEDTETQRHKNLLRIRLLSSSSSRASCDRGRPGWNLHHPRAAVQGLSSTH